MPWKFEKDPYKIWLSEIILQQTRVEQGLKYYESFIRAYPTIKALAVAPEDEVFKLWEGLGYYSRCRNLIASAKYIASELDGVFPDDYHQILSLKGVGSYTAAAIASFAYNQPYAVLDGNVFRVLSRILDIETPIDSTAGRSQFAALAQSLLPEGKAGVYNQAIMDFGATICKPVPECGHCFFSAGCKAYHSGKQQLLPIKEKKLVIRSRWMNYIMVQWKNKIAVRQRTGKDIWQQLFEFCLIETSSAVSADDILQDFEKQFGIHQYKRLGSNTEVTQKLTHQLLHFNFISIEVTKKPSLEGFVWMGREELRQAAFSITLKSQLERHLSKLRQR